MFALFEIVCFLRQHWARVPVWLLAGPPIDTSPLRPNIAITKKSASWPPSLFLAEEKIAGFVLDFCLAVGSHAPWATKADSRNPYEGFIFGIAVRLLSGSIPRRGGARSPSDMGRSRKSLSSTPRSSSRTRTKKSAPREHDTL
jgi:hypothetical protein